MSSRISFAADINECTPNPCQNGGSCTDMVDGYVCSCAAGYTGTNCEEGQYSWYCGKNDNACIYLILFHTGFILQFYESES